jgi:hypothetical protein
LQPLPVASLIQGSEFSILFQELHSYIMEHTLLTAYIVVDNDNNFMPFFTRQVTQIPNSGLLLMGSTFIGFICQ